MADDASPDHDAELGAALRALTVPDHAPGFDDAVLAELHSDVTRGRVEPTRLGRAGRWRRGHPRFLPLAAAAVLVAVVAAVVVVVDRAGEDGADQVLVTPGPDGEGGGDPDDDAESDDQAASPSRGGTVSGELVRRWIGEDERRIAFTVAGDGSFRLLESGRSSDIAYDARTLELRLVEGEVSAITRGVPPGGPRHAFGAASELRELGWVARALARLGSEQVTETMHEGRAAWRLEVDFRPNELGGPPTIDRVEAIVDQETGVALRTRWLAGATLVEEVVVEGLQVDGPERGFSFDLPPGSDPFAEDLGFRPADPDTVPFGGLFPREVPAGFTLTGAAVSEEEVVTGAEGSNPATAPVVALTFQRGLDRFTVMIRPAGDRPDLWSDPFGGEGEVVAAQEIVLERGALAGATGELVLDPRQVPHLWVVTDDLVVTVSGGLDRDELLTVAESLQRRDG